MTLVFPSCCDCTVCTTVTVTVASFHSLLFEEEGRSGLDPLVGVGSAGQTDVRDHLHPLRAGVQRQPYVLV